MGITISSKNFSIDMGYFGFNRFRNKISEHTNVEFEKHYKSLDTDRFTVMFDEEKSKEFYKKYNTKTETLIQKGFVTVQVANFLYQCDCNGSINQEQSKEIYELIKNEDDSLVYGYTGRKDCATMKDMKEIFKDCAENGGTVGWS